MSTQHKDTRLVFIPTWMNSSIQGKKCPYAKSNTAADSMRIKMKEARK